MSKTISANMATHLGLSSTTLAFCIKLTREDATVLGFTTHDLDLVFDGVTYEASTGYMNGSNVQGSSNMNVDNMEFDAFMSSTKIKESDLRNGVYDNADIRIFIVNHQDLTMDEVKIARGRLGNIDIGRYAFHAELRRMLQAYSRQILRLHTTECDADFADARCGLDIADYRSLVRVDTVTSNDNFTVEEFIETVTLPMSLTNPGAETGDITGWTEETFNLEATTVKTRTGTYGFVCKDNHSGCIARQRVDLVAQGVPTAAIDLGEASWTHALWVNPDPSKTGQTRIRFLDTSQVEISATSLTATPTADTWTQVITSADIPVDTRYIDILWHGGGGSFSPYAYFDDTTASVDYVDRSPVTPDTVPGLDTDDFFLYGVVEWLSGANTGLFMEIIGHVGATQTLQLLLPGLYDVVADDEFYLIRGCPKTLAACRDTFSNIENFRGFPYLPLSDATEYPDAQS